MVSPFEVLLESAAMAPTPSEHVGFLTLGSTTYPLDVCPLGPLLMEQQIWDGIKTLRYAYPAFALFYFIIAHIVTVCTLQTRKLRVRDQHVRRDVILGLISGIAATYVSFLSPIFRPRFNL
jgi:hypothetical protein